MIRPQYTVLWSASKMVSVTENLVDYWNKRILDMNARMALLGAIAADPYLSEGKTLKRQIHEARTNLYDAALHYQEAKAAAESNRESWTVKSDDLPWYFPNLDPPNLP